ncbi:MAG: DNA gyrase C-terminal beta-propeller domain-containing protein, partial [Flavobacteriales bacterium]
GRTASGVRGITLASSDQVIGMVCVEDFSRTIMVVSENGFGKRTLLNDAETNEPIYRITNRGGKGVKTLNITEKTGNLIAIKSVTDEDDLMIINKSGITIRMHVADIRTQGRATQGVKLINLKGKDQIAAVAKVEKDDEEDLLDENLNIQISDNPSENNDISTDESNDASPNDNE